MTELLLLVKSQLDIKMTSYYNFKRMLLFHTTLFPSGLFFAGMI